MLGNISFYFLLEFVKLLMKKNPFGCFGFVSYIIIRLLLRQVGTGKDDRSELAFMGGGAV